MAELESENRDLVREVHRFQSKTIRNPPVKKAKNSDAVEKDGTNRFEKVKVDLCENITVACTSSFLLLEYTILTPLKLMAELLIEFSHIIDVVCGLGTSCEIYLGLTRVRYRGSYMSAHYISFLLNEFTIMI